jgi:assimilatory nitrate reductase catalytic subunit
VGCGIDVIAATANTIDKVASEQANSALSDLTGTAEHPANFGRLCIKGSHLLETTQLAGRMTSPSIEGENATWDEATDAISNKIKLLLAEHGPKSIALYVSGQLLTEDYYVANKLMKGFIGSANIDTNSRLCMSSAVAAYKRAFGEDIVPTCYDDIDKTDLLVLVGSNAAWTHPVLFQRMERAKQINPALKIIQIDTRRTASSSIADLHLQLKPSSDAVLFNGLLRYIDEQQANTDFIDQATCGYLAALAAAMPYNTANVAALCDLEEAKVVEFYELFVQQASAITFYSMGINQSSSGVDKANAIINCHLATGKIGVEGSGPFSITGQPNAMGGREVGGLANMLAAHMDIENSAHRKIVQDFWQAPNIVTQNGLKAVDMFDAMLSGEIKFVWIMGTNPVVSMPNRSKIEKALKRCEMVVVSDVVQKNDTLTLANIALPATPWSEKDGTVTNSERCISRQRSMLPPTGDAKHDWQIISEVAKKLGFAEAFDYKQPCDIFKEHASLSGAGNHGTRAFDISALANITQTQYEKLVPIQWPVNKTQPLGTKRLFTDGVFFTANQKANFIAIVPRLPEQITTLDYPFILNTGRTRDQWHTMTRTGNAARLHQHTEQALLSIHPIDAKRLIINNNDIIELKSSQGLPVLLPALIDDSIRQGELFVPIHWSKSSSSHVAITELFSDANDPISGQPELKHAAVSAQKVNIQQFAHISSRQPIPATLLEEFSDYWTSTKLHDCILYRLALFTNNPLWLSDIQHKFNSSETVLSANLDNIAATLVALNNQRVSLVVHIGKVNTVANSQWLDYLFALPEIEAQQLHSIIRYSPDASFTQGKLICSCHTVRSKTIEEAILNGSDTVELLGAELKCGTNCGSCKGELASIIADTKSSVTSHETRPRSAMPLSTIPATTIPIITIETSK